jgi:hypothetical protein
MISWTVSSPETRPGFTTTNPSLNGSQMEWRQKSLPQKKKLKTAHSAGKVMCTVFWDRKGIILVDFLEQGLTINAARYVETLESRIARVRLEKKEHVLVQHDNARPHTHRTALILLHRTSICLVQ